MKKLLLCLLAVVMAFSLAACGGSNSGNNGGGTTTPPSSTPNNSGNSTTTPPASSAPSGNGDEQEYAEEFTILLGSSDEWKPFPSESDVKFQVTNESVLSIEHDGTTVEFTGTQLGESVIWAFGADTTLKALVLVVSGSGNGTGETGKGLYIENARSGEPAVITCYITTERVSGETEAQAVISENKYVGMTEAVTVTRENSDDILHFPWATQPPAGDAYTIVAVVSLSNGDTEYYAASGSMGQGLNVDNGENKPWGLFVEFYPGS